MKKRSKSKYGNHKIQRDGQTFDSVNEYLRFCELTLLERAGKIKDLRRQVEYELIPAQYEEIPTGAFYKRGDRKGQPKMKRVCVEQKCSYVADFVYFENGQTVVEDTKGVRTKDYIIKRKLMLSVHKIKINEV